MKRYLSLLVIFALAGATMVFPVHSASNTATETAQAWLVQLSSPLPAALSTEDTSTSIQSIHTPENIYLITDPSLVEFLEEEDMLSWAEPDMDVELLTDAESTNETDTSQWQLDMLNISRGDVLGCFGQGIRVGVIDSGCSPHDELISALIPGHNYLLNTDDTCDNVGHGTFVSGLIAAADDGVGITGAAPGVELLPLKCFDKGATTRVSTITAAIYDAVDTYNCDIINMSFGLKSYSKSLDAAISYAVDHKVVCVASAGNKSTSAPYYPAAFPNVISVGAVDSTGCVAHFSQRNDSLSVMAPGVDIYSTSNTGEYTTNSGTSFSAPLVSALCARLLCADNSLTPQDVMHLLTASAIDSGDEGYDNAYGYGLADLNGAMDLLLASTDYYLSPFHYVDDQLQISLFNNTDQELSGQCIFTQYQQAFMEDIAWYDFCLTPGEAVTICSPLFTNTVKCTVWSSLQDISPLTPYQECEVPCHEK